jgi:hypothetical protein
MLSQATLKTEFLKLMDSTSPDFAGWPPTKAAAAANWCNAYNVYALSAQDVSGDPLVSANLPGMISTLVSLLPEASPTATYKLAADAFDAAFASYWTGALFAFLVPPVPAPLGCPNIGGTTIWSVEAESKVFAVASGVLGGLLEAEFAVVAPDVDTKAASLAAAFHSATISAVTVLIKGSDSTLPTPIPIQNACTIT